MQTKYKIGKLYTAKKANQLKIFELIFKVIVASVELQ